jgi:hypothetical protein
MGYFWDEHIRVFSPRFLYKYVTGWEIRGLVLLYYVRLCYVTFCPLMLCSILSSRVLECSSQWMRRMNKRMIRRCYRILCCLFLYVCL